MKGGKIERKKELKDRERQREREDLHLIIFVFNSSQKGTWPSGHRDIPLVITDGKGE